jgi:hypothetical protein
VAAKPPCFAADSVIGEGQEENIVVFGNTLHRLFAVMHAWGPAQASALRFELCFRRGVTSLAFYWI